MDECGLIVRIVELFILGCGHHVFGTDFDGSWCSGVSDELGRDYRILFGQGLERQWQTWVCELCSLSEVFYRLYASLGRSWRSLW